jgi:predicted ribosome quality control (RQC) complex YloA/Tae2 family protein
VHQNYYFLKKLAPAIHSRLKGKLFIESFSQEKDELVLVFADSEVNEELVNPFFIKATLRSNFASLSFPDSFQRARRNSVNLFNSFSNHTVESVRVFVNERAIEISFKQGDALVFKLFGNRSNIIAFDKNRQILEVFNHKLTVDQTIDYNALDRRIDQSYEAYERNDFNHEKLFPTFGKLVNNWLIEKLDGENIPAGRWEIIQDTLQSLDRGQFYLIQKDFVPALSLLPLGEIRETFESPIDAQNSFYYAYIRLTGIEKEKAEIVRILKKRIQQTEHYLENTFNKLADLESGVKNDEIANILMANLHQIPARVEKIELFDFYHDQNVTIKLKKDLSPQKNAEGYYRKSKNEKIELAKLHESLEAREKELVKSKEQLAAIGKIELLRELRTYIKVNGLAGGIAVLPTQADLFKRVDFQGFTIWIGRNAKNNDLLTRQYAFKEDLWLHARDVAGSHVIIKFQPGKKFPSTVIERAASLAAFYSKRRTDSLCPVIVTPKKYVRKPKWLFRKENSLAERL